MGGDLIDYVMRLENAFDIRIPDNLAVELMTVGKMHDYLVGRLPALQTQVIWDRQLDVLCNLLRLNPKQRTEIGPKDHLVRDLGFT